MILLDMLVLLDSTVAYSILLGNGMHDMYITNKGHFLEIVLRIRLAL